MIKLDYSETYPTHTVEYHYKSEVICEIKEPWAWPEKGWFVDFDDKEYFVTDIKHYPVTQKTIIFLIVN